MDLDLFQAEVVTWGNATFPGSTFQSKTRHLLDEVRELYVDRTGEELADCFLILLHMAGELGVSLADEAERKFSICLSREWLPPDEHGVVRHKK